MASLKDKLVLETVLKRREQAEESYIYSNLEAERSLQDSKRKSKVPKLKSAASFIASSRNRQKSLNFLRSQQYRNRTHTDVQGGALLVVKIHVSVHADNQVKKALKAIGLARRYSAVLLQDTPQNAELVRIAEPFITYGPATEKTIESLVRKRGRIVQKGKETLLKDNVAIEDALGSQGIICLEDLVYELTHPSDHFEPARKLLRPFQLNSPLEKFKKTAYSKGGDYGFRGEAVNSLVESLN
jgi:large subunit ribosomal protein L7e